MRFSALALRVGDPIDICVDGTFGRWRRTVVTAVRRDGVRVAGLRAPATTGVACPWCGEPVVMTDTPTPDLQLFYCPGCGHRWWLDHDLTNA